MSRNSNESVAARSMCSRLLKTPMDNYQGDLTDILRASGSNPAAAEGGAAAPLPEWQFPDHAISYAACPEQDFGQPFPFLRDPLVHDPAAAGFFHTGDVIRDETAGFANVGVESNNNCAMRINLDDHEKRPPNIFSRMLQISPTAKLSGDSAAVLASPGPPQRVLMSPNNSKSCLMESPGLQISSPRNTGIRRRKSQAKKVVCIPAPAPANSRSTGEVVPSDLWAWRKYGQKPIKGSPYPRGYYRCSSSKGCSARKQVERSRTDPNMLVITYTSEHNHPWPTQRNALAGSTRSQPSKTPTAAKTSPSSQSQKPKEEQAELTAENAGSALVKEEMDQDFDHQLEMEDDHDFQRSYKPMLPETNHPSDDSFFADLGEIESDSLDLLLFDGRDGKGLDPFSFYDWSVNTAAPGSSAAAGAAAAASSSGASSRGDL